MNVEWENKINLTAALRMAARLDLHEGVDNHFSLMVSDKPFRFLLNPNRRHWSQLRASELVEVDESGKPINDSEPPERTAFLFIQEFTWPVRRLNVFCIRICDTRQR